MQEPALAGRPARSARYWLPAILWGLLILAMSTRSESFFFPVAPRRGPDSLRLCVEVAVHLVQFSVFAMLLRRPLRALAWRESAIGGAAVAGVVALSLVNESLQALIPTRMFDMADVMVDTTGGFIASMPWRWRSAGG